jgi:flavin-dependent dehydrogenase
VAVERRSVPSERLAERFSLAAGVGCSLHAVLAAGTSPSVSSGFLVTHRDSITVGVHVTGADAPEDVRAALTAFGAHPAVAPYLKGAPLVAGSARCAPVAQPRRHLEGRGWLLAGDSAGLPDFHGAVLRGRNRALRSGWLAGEEVARSAGVPGTRAARPTGHYPRRLRSEGVDVGAARSQDPIVGDPRIHRAYPDLLAAAFHRLMTEESHPKEPVAQALRATRRSSRRTWSAIVRDATGAMRRL